MCSILLRVNVFLNRGNAIVFRESEKIGTLSKMSKNLNNENIEIPTHTQRSNSNRNINFDKRFLANIENWMDFFTR